MDNNKIIYFLTTKENLIDTLKQLYGNQGYTFLSFDAARGLPDNLRTLLLIEPLNLDREYYSVNQLWKNYLYKHRPEARLIVAAYAQSRHANLFSLLDFPKDLKQFLAHAKPVSDYPFVHVGTEEKFGEKRDKYMDSWGILLPHSGRPAIREMQRFLDGHDRNKSFSAQLFRMRSLLRDWATYSAEERHSSQDKLREEFVSLLQRWYFYFKLFDYLPFAGTLLNISNDLFSIKEQIDKQGEPDATAQEKLAQIYQLTQDVINPIVFPLDYW